MESRGVGDTCVPPSVDAGSPAPAGSPLSRFQTLNQCLQLAHHASSQQDFQKVPITSHFRHCATFFRNFFCRQRVPPSSFLQQTEVSKSPKGPPFLVFRHYEIVSKISFFVFFSKIFPKKFLYFLNVSKGSPLSSFSAL